MSILHFADAVPELVAPGRTRYMTQTEHLMMVVMDFTDGPASQPDPPHSHPHEQVTYVVEGEVRFFLDGRPSRLKAGDLVSIPGNVPHCIQVLTPRARLVDVFTPIREDFLKR